MTAEYLKRIGLTEDQIKAVRDGLRKESRYRQLMLGQGVYYMIACGVTDQTDPDTIDLSNEELLIEKIRAEFIDYK